MFADDTKVSHKISNENDGALLHQDLKRLMEWSKNCHLDFNVEKCKIIKTRSSADADNGLDAFSGQSRSTNMVPFWVHCDFSLSM